jgi:hypothetical protein
MYLCFFVDRSSILKTGNQKGEIGKRRHWLKTSLLYLVAWIHEKKTNKLNYRQCTGDNCSMHHYLSCHLDLVDETKILYELIAPKNKERASSRTNARMTIRDEENQIWH